MRYIEHFPGQRPKDWAVAYGSNASRLAQRLLTRLRPAAAGPQGHRADVLLLATSFYPAGWRLPTHLSALASETMRAIGTKLAPQKVDLFDLAALQSHREIIGPDGIHPTPEGARLAWGALQSHLARIGLINKASTARCRADGGVLVDGELLAATHRCNRGSAPSVELAAPACDGSGLSGGARVFYVSPQSEQCHA